MPIRLAQVVIFRLSFQPTLEDIPVGVVWLGERFDIGVGPSQLAVLTIE